MSIEKASAKQLIRFESQPLPDNWNLAKELEARFQKPGFRFSDDRGAANYVQQLADSKGLEYTRFRGTIVANGYEINDLVWIAILHPDNGQPAVIEPALPIYNSEFRELLGCYVAGDIGVDRLDDLVKNRANFKEIVLGEFPEDVDFFGEPFWR